jgi:hypothetical protein
MFNHHVADEEIKERIKQRMQEAETYSLQKRLGYGDSGSARWLFVLLLVVVTLVVVGIML